MSSLSQLWVTHWPATLASLEKLSISERPCLKQRVEGTWGHNRLSFVCVTAGMGKVSWQSGAKEYHKVTPHNKPHTRAFSGREKHRRVAASAEVRSSVELSRRRGLYSISYGWCFPGWPGIGGILWPDFRASSGIDGIFFSVEWDMDTLPSQGAENSHYGC